VALGWALAEGIWLYILPIPVAFLTALAAISWERSRWWCVKIEVFEYDVEAKTFGVQVRNAGNEPVLARLLVEEFRQITGTSRVKATKHGYWEGNATEIHLNPDEPSTCNLVLVRHDESGKPFLRVHVNEGGEFNIYGPAYLTVRVEFLDPQDQKYLVSKRKRFSITPDDAAAGGYRITPA
jgi:hypothetical protein